MVDENHFIAMLVVISIFARTMRLGNFGGIALYQAILDSQVFFLGGFTIIEQRIAGLKVLKVKLEGKALRHVKDTQS